MNVYLVYQLRYVNVIITCMKRGPCLCQCDCLSSAVGSMVRLVEGGYGTAKQVLGVDEWPEYLELALDVVPIPGRRFGASR